MSGWISALGTTVSPSQGRWVGTDQDEMGDEVAPGGVVAGSLSRATESSATSAIATRGRRITQPAAGEVRCRRSVPRL
jgi:hypothetical protein